MKYKNVINNITSILLLYLMVPFCVQIGAFDLIFLLGFAFALGVVLTNSYAIPSRLVFKYRFQLKGLALFSFLAIIMVIKDWIVVGKLSEYDFIGIIGGPVVGFFVFGFLTEQSLKSEFEKKDLNYFKECSAMFDQTSYKINDEKKSGKLVLVEQRLFFYKDNIETPLFDYNLKDRIPEIKVFKRWGMPSGFWIDEQIKVSVNFPKFWRREILINFESALAINEPRIL